ncbi:hypothetical protein [Acidovorax sp. SDU_ACID1]|uniref:hypothetical protein n=1 Tax=Acidovorax sp. SDU_ACID1 TaxID=3136632 RepID=UPI00387363A9
MRPVDGAMRVRQHIAKPESYLGRGAQPVQSVQGDEELEQDFLALSPADIGLCDAVIANSPFTRGQYIAHVRHMWRSLRPGGMLVSPMPPVWRTGRTRAQRAFWDFVERLGTHVEALLPGAFSASGTDAATVRIRVVKPA